MFFDIYIINTSHQTFSKFMKPFYIFFKGIKSQKTMKHMNWIVNDKYIDLYNIQLMLKLLKQNTGSNPKT
jgi:hypothetical protein